MCSRCFNGATSNQTWKQVFIPGKIRVRPGLQWGHVQSDVETEEPQSRQTKISRLQWGHVQSDVETGCPLA